MRTTIWFVSMYLIGHFSKPGDTTSFIAVVLLVSFFVCVAQDIKELIK